MKIANIERRRLSLVAACLAASFGSAAFADDLSPPLNKEETTALVVGKKIEYLRKRDGAKQAYDFKTDGTVYFTTSATMRNTSFSGTYTVEDDGAICLKWNADKYVAMQDSCQRLRRDGDKMVLVTKRNPDMVLGDIVQ